jgi:hypothetical protein
MDSMLERSNHFGDFPDFADLEAAGKILALAEHQLEVSRK